MSQAAGGLEPPRAFLEFRILRKLGTGAMGEVFLAEDELLGRQVAIKFVRQADRPDMRARFVLEARALARLQHPNVVTVHRVGEVLGRPFLVSEWVDGQSLDKQALPLELRRVLQVAVQLARALAAAHRVGVLHRDVKPGNVLLTESGELKLVDFGVSAPLGMGDPGGEAPGQSGAAPSLQRSAASLAETQPLGTATPTPGASAGPAELQVGTPLYAAPELLSGGAGTRQSDLYAWGAVVYEVCAGRPPHVASSLEELRAQAESGPPPPLASAPQALDALVRRCLSPRAADRPGRAEELLEILEPLLLADSGSPAPEQPYRGLAMFGPEHASLFFGRAREVQAVVERLRGAAFVLVAGDSGVGKSSLCRAGVLPLLAAGAVERARRTRVIEVGLGARPVEALAAALSPWTGRPERATADALRAAPEELAAVVRAAPEAEGRALFIDNLEDLVSSAPSEDVECVGRFLGALALRAPGFRWLATARSDFLTRLSALPSLGPEIGDALYLLRPLTEEGLRQAIEGPARASGYRFAPESLVDELVAAARRGPGALPLVQFALAELWRQRDAARRLISGEALAAMGGVEGALARHADGAVAALPAKQQRAAEQILRRLVTAQGTRARRPREELPAGRDAERALAALTTARIVSARDPVEEGDSATFELAHEALIQGWDQLRAWLGQDAEKRAVAQRVERAAEEWERLGGGAEGLWSRLRIAEVERVADLPLGARELRFLSASRGAARRRLTLQIVTALALPAMVLLVVFGARARARAASRAEASLRLEGARASLSHARELAWEEAGLARAALAQFDAGDAAAGERGWARVRGFRAAMEAELVAARAGADSAQLLAASDAGRQLVQDLLLFRLEQEGNSPLSSQRDGLLAQLAPLDPRGILRAPFERPARLRVEGLGPPGAVTAMLRPARATGRPAVLFTAGTEQPVAPGSYVLEAGPRVRLPLLLGFGERRTVQLPRQTRAREGFIVLPQGTFLTGFDGDDDVRIGFFGAPPLHTVATGAFAIARTEVTFGEWLEFLRALPPGERDRRLPRAQTLRNALSLRRRADGRYVLRMQPTTVALEAAEGEPLVYPGRAGGKNAAVDWGKLPVSGISFEDAEAFASFLDASGRVPGARLCREDEWERAARGADGRSFPGGDTLAGDDANIDETYGRNPLSFGPDPVGSHPRSDSPVGAADMAGNAWEFTVSRTGTPAIRGGSWYQGALTARSVNREPYERTARDLLAGLRLCASEPEP